MPSLNITQYPWNLTSISNSVSNSSVSLPGSITKAVTLNLPWFFPMLTLIFAIAIWVLFAGDPGKEKFVYITFLTMILSWLMKMFDLAGVIAPTLWTSMFVITTIWYLMTRDR